MKPRWLVGLVAACSGGGRMETAFPLCDRDGAPACGNIGQVGRPVTRATNVQVLLAAGVNTGVPIARPLLDGDARPAPGNCVGKCGDRDRRVEHGEPRLARARPAGGAAPHLVGSRIVALGRGALVSDEDSGALIAVDAEGRNVGSVAIGRGAGLAVVDPQTREAFVADRSGARVVVVGTDALAESRSWRTPREPYGVALTPDLATLLVTAIADRALVAYDPRDGTQRWRVGLGPEPRGVAISPDGTHALVSYLAVGRVDRIDLRSRRVAPIALRTGAGTAYARAAFTPLFVGPAFAIVPFQREVPVPDGEPLHASGGYGGVRSPITHHLAWLDGDRQSQVRIDDQLPRALAHDPARDRLFVAGLGTDVVVTLEHATTSELAEGRRIVLSRPDEPRCGPDGLAVSSRQLLVWCAFTRRVTRIDLEAEREQTGPSLIASPATELELAGRVLFHAADPRLSDRGSLACASCHPDGRTDGLSWLVGNVRRQTPILAGRVRGTGPYKWDGSDPDLAASVRSTALALGGARRLDVASVNALVAYVERMPPVVPPTRDRAAIARGRAVFVDEGCAECHAGARLTDGQQHALESALAKADTPSLAGLAASAPYYHDGSAPTLEALLAGRARVHGMVDPAALTPARRADLAAYLESL